MTLEGNLKMIKDAKLDIELLRRKNEIECAERNAEIANLQNKIILTESKLEEELKTSGEKKLECKLGWCSFREMPDKWEYDDKELTLWLDALPQALKIKYINLVVIIKKNDLKKEIIKDNEEFSEKGKIIKKYLDTEVAGHEIVLHTKEKDYRVCGIKIEQQEPKFNYKINGGI